MTDEQQRLYMAILDAGADGSTYFFIKDIGIRTVGGLFGGGDTGYVHYCLFQGGARPSIYVTRPCDDADA